MLTTGVETRMERERSRFRPLYNFSRKRNPRLLEGGSRRAHETLLRRCSGRIRRNEEKSHETE